MVVQKTSVSFRFFDGLLSADPPHADGTLEHDGDDGTLEHDDDDGTLPEGKASPDNTARLSGNNSVPLLSSSRTSWSDSKETLSRSS